MADTINWHEMYDYLREQHNEASELNRKLVQAYVVNDAKRQMVNVYIQDHPSAETNEILDILNSHMTYEEAKEKIKELHFGDYDVIGYGFSKDEQHIRS